MDLRCLVFSSDGAATPLICQALAELGGEAEHCPDAAAAIGLVASESFQIVIADWDEQPNAEYLLKAARARKPAERPLTLAVVSDDPSVPKALQAGANSVLRKPVLLNQVKDTLETARSLLKAKQDSAISAPPAAVQNSSSALSTKLSADEPHLRAGDFLTSARPAPGAQFETESELQKEIAPSAGAIDQLKDLEPMAAAVAPERAAPTPAATPVPNEPRGLQWYLNQRATSLPSTPTVPMPAPPAAAPPQLMGYDQMAARPEAEPSESHEPLRASQPDPVVEQKTEAELFSYIKHGKEDSAIPSEQANAPGFRLGKRAIVFALALTACAMVAAPQAPWHPAARRLWARGQRSLHAWLNPQIVEPTQVPESHENFARAGDEYKLPVAEAIPDATTDPSQIRVTPVVDPTAKKPGNNGTDQNADATATAADSAQPSEGQAAGAQVQASPSQPTPANLSTASARPANAVSTGSGIASPSSAQLPSSSLAPTKSTASPALQVAANSSATPPVMAPVPRPAQKANPTVVTVAANAIPSSLKSQMASTVPDASGNKSPDTALPAIEPVTVSEAAERALLTAQPVISYPADAKGQQGTVILQLLVDRDGSVQDAKFLQGSLAFARAAIGGVQSWKFKPYLLNGRPVSVQTQLTLTFSPTK
jgi:periplasmic protein TonB